MSETALRQALVAAITVSIIGVAALALGGLIAPLPTGSGDNGTFVVNAILIRSVLVIIGLGLIGIITYLYGFRLVSAASPTEVTTPTPDPSASSNLVSLVTTPGSRRDALLGGGIITFSYWLITLLYTMAFGKFLGQQPLTQATLGQFLSSHVLEGVVLLAAGLGLGALGARTALARRMTSAALNVPSITEILNRDAQRAKEAQAEAEPTDNTPA